MSLQIQKLYFSYPTSHVTLFEDFSLQFYDSWTCVAGSNGCGKSTLLKSFARLLPPMSGQILLDGKNFSSPKIIRISFFSTYNKIIHDKIRSI